MFFWKLLCWEAIQHWACATNTCPCLCFVFALILSFNLSSVFSNLDQLCLWSYNFGNLVDPEKRKRSPTDSAGSPGSKESPSGRMETARPQNLLNVPRLQLPHHTTGKGARHFDTRSLNEENFIASIGVYTTPAPVACALLCEILYPAPYKLINTRTCPSPSPNHSQESPFPLSLTVLQVF